MCRPAVRWSEQRGCQAVAPDVAWSPAPMSSAGEDGCQEPRTVRERLLALLVRDGRARMAGQGQHRAALEAGIRAPGTEVRTGEVESVAELDQHVERDEQAEQVLAPLVVDQVLHGDERSAHREGVVG